MMTPFNTVRFGVADRANVQVPAGGSAFPKTLPAPTADSVQFSGGSQRASDKTFQTAADSTLPREKRELAVYAVLLRERSRGFIPKSDRLEAYIRAMGAEGYPPPSKEDEAKWALKLEKASQAEPELLRTYRAAMSAMPEEARKVPNRITYQEFEEFEAFRNQPAPWKIHKFLRFSNDQEFREVQELLFFLDFLPEGVDKVGVFKATMEALREESWENRHGPKNKKKNTLL